MVSHSDWLNEHRKRLTAASRAFLEASEAKEAHAFTIRAVEGGLTAMDVLRNEEAYRAAKAELIAVLADGEG